MSENEENEQQQMQQQQQQKSSSNKNLILNQAAISGLQPGTLIQCNKCWDTFLADEFASHFKYAHESFAHIGI
jgi:hypothetical protein